MNGRSRAIVVVDLAFGDCGKGSIVDYLTRQYDAKLVVRFNGGPQAGHNVVLPDGRHHTFSQFGSGTFVDGVQTLLGRHVLIEPYALINEARHLEQLGVVNPWGRLWIDSRCIVITPIHQAANRLRELSRGKNAHGTCGMGVGEAVGTKLRSPDLTIRANELANAESLSRKLREQARTMLEEFPSADDSQRSRVAHATLTDLRWIDIAVENYAFVHERVQIVDDPEKQFRSGMAVIFEGAQGVLLDENFGFHPHTTWSNTTSHNAHAMLDECGFDFPRETIGVLRSYFTRHGAGPFVTEDQSLSAKLDEPHNDAEGWQARFRVGVFDAVAARYALRCDGRVDSLAITHLDYLDRLPGKICDRYQMKSGEIVTELDASRISEAQPQYSAVAVAPEGFVARMRQELAGTPVRIQSFGPTWQDKRITHRAK